MSFASVSCAVLALTLSADSLARPLPRDPLLDEKRATNVIVIMADDLGAEGLGCYGSSIYSTPHLDRLAANGMRFENAYTSPLCTPTRVSIMSGLHPNRTGFRALITRAKGMRMPAAIPTFGHDFRGAGFATAVMGKWQLGKFDEFPGQPVSHGFDAYCLWTWIYENKVTSRYYAPHLHVGRPAGPAGATAPAPDSPSSTRSAGTFFQGTDEDFGPEEFRKFALDFIDAKKDEPFFLYFPMALVHSPFIHPPELDALAKSRFIDGLDDKTQAFGHMVTYMDDVVGDIVDRLEAHGIANRTLVIFTGDNGTHRRITSRIGDLEIKGGKGTMTEAGARVPLIAWQPGAVSKGVCDELFSLVDILPTVTSWAGIEIERSVDGLDLSHLLTGDEGENRDHVAIHYKNGYFVRDKRFRLNEKGQLFDVPVTSDAERYSERIADEASHKADRERLGRWLNAFMAIEQEFEKPGVVSGPKKGGKKR